jgi:hypothetical protein
MDSIEPVCEDCWVGVYNEKLKTPDEFIEWMGPQLKEHARGRGFSIEVPKQEDSDE